MKRDRIAEPWGARTPYGSGDDWPTRVDTFSLARTQRQVTWCKSTIKVLSPQALAAV
jgi:hypothetical protein